MLHARPDHQGRFTDAGAAGDLAMGEIPSDEPVVLLRGQDVAAPAALEAWADENDRLIAEGKHSTSPSSASGAGDPRLSELMRRQAAKMRGFQESTAHRYLAAMPAGMPTDLDPPPPPAFEPLLDPTGEPWPEAVQVALRARMGMPEPEPEVVEAPMAEPEPPEVLDSTTAPAVEPAS